MTVLYLRDTCEQAGVKTKSVFIEDIGWDAPPERFRRSRQSAHRTLLQALSVGMALARGVRRPPRRDRVQFIEPTWKMLLSNKGLLPILWELFPGSSESAARLRTRRAARRTVMSANPSSAAKAAT